VQSKELLKSSGVMGSNLTPFLKFNGYALVLSVVNNKCLRIMISNNEVIIVNKNHVEVIL